MIYALRLTAAVIYELKLSWRYFRARRKSAARFTAIAAVVGIAAGVAALIVAQAVTRGFAREIREKLLARTAHVAVFRADGATLADYEQRAAELQNVDNVTTVEATVYQSALVAGAGTTTYCVLRATTESARAASDPQPATGTIAVGAKLAEKTGLRPGDAAELIFPAGLTANTRRFTVGEIFRTGLYDYDATWIYLAREDFAALAGEPKFAPTVLNVFVADVYAARRTAREIGARIGGEFKVLDWQEANEPLFAALDLERKVSLTIIALIIFVAALNITTTLMLLVVERRGDIAVLRVCGMRTNSLLRIFLFEGLMLAATGAIVGTGAGLLLCFALNQTQIISLPAEVYSITTIRLQPDLADVALIVAVTVAAALAATIVPALRAARIKPAANLRDS